MCSRFQQLGRRVSPTDFATVLLAGGDGRMRWGLPVEWGRRPLINARAETLQEKPTFRRLSANRLLVLADLWWEWRDGRRYRLGLDGGGPMTFAGLFDGGCFTLVTRQAAPELAAIHDRMPAVLPEPARADWLSGGADIVGLLAEPGLAYRADACDPMPAQGELF
jgi:putative SOS response-associated peptidase YedK